MKDVLMPTNAPLEPSAKEWLKIYHVRVEKLLQDAVLHLTPPTELTQACLYAVLGEGKRLRPILLLMIADALCPSANVSSVAAAVEMFHCASLIADDLPSMDDDDYRRGRPSVHKVYGEAVAIMASYALISEGYSAIYNNTLELIESGVAEAERRGLIAVQNVAYNAGIFGATGGQFIDLVMKEPTIDQLEEILRKKTASIFEISCVLGWLFAGGKLESLEEVKALALNLGIAFQLIDDLDDMQQDSERKGSINYASLIGKQAAYHKALIHLEQCDHLLVKLNLATPALVGIVAILRKQIFDK
jgi:geranylgeranyl diphosphate synthase type II